MSEKRSYEERKETLVNLFEDDLYTEDMVKIWNEYCENGGLYDDQIFRIGDIDEFFSSASDLMEALDKFSSAHNYFHFNGYGNVITLDDCDVFNEMDLNALAKYCLDEEDSLHNDDIQDLLDEFAEEDEEDEEEDEDDEDEEE